MHNPRFIAYSHRGFSLIEVVIAVGLVTTSLLALIALLGSAASSAAEAAARTTASQIATKIYGEVQLARWQDLPSLPSGINDQRYFDEFGEELIGTGVENQANYTARLILRTTPPRLVTKNNYSRADNQHFYQAELYVAAVPGVVGSREINDRIAGNKNSRVYLFATALSHQEK